VGSAAFSETQALTSVRKLSAQIFAGRRTGTPGHERARRWIEQRFRRLGLNPRCHRFSAPASTVRAGGLPTATFSGRDHRLGRIRYRFDFVEHPASAAQSGLLSGQVERLRDSPQMEGRWAILDPRGGPTDSINDGSRLGSSHGVVGLLLPARMHPGGTFFKQPFAGQPLELPTFFVRENLLTTIEGGRLEVRARLQRFQLRGVNIISELPGAAPELAQRPLIIGAHYDGVGDDPGGIRFPGASDNAVGVAVVLETARVLRSESPDLKHPVWFVTFDAEESGAYGSRALAHDLGVQGLRPSVINVDAATAQGGPLSIEGTPDARPVFEILDRGARKLGIPLSIGSVASDNRPFAAEGFTSVGIGLGGQGFHSPHDTASRVDPKGLRNAGELLLETIRGIAG
jgi:aminopeptidase YwaD